MNKNKAGIATIVQYLKNQIQAITDSVIHKSDELRNIMDLGVDSIGLVNITDTIKRDYDIDLQPTVFFEYQSIAELSVFLAAELGHVSVPSSLESYSPPKSDKDTFRISPLEPETQRHDDVISADKHSYASVDDRGESLLTMDDIFDQFQKKNGSPINRNTLNIITSTSKKPASDDIAVIGMAGRFSGSDNLEMFWKNLVDQKDLFSDIPEDRFDYQKWRTASSASSDHIYCNRGSFIDDVDKFDAGFFNIPPKEAAILDPQLRLLLQVIYETVEDAGYGNRIRGSNTGMYVGACFHDYELELVRHLGEMSPYFGIGNALTMLANRPSFYLDLKGPSMPLDTACSASLVAIHSALQALRNGECEMAFVSGTNLLLSPLHYRYFCTIGALSKSGGSYPFDSRADGYIPGETVGSVLLKPLIAAERDGDQIHAIIKSAAVNHGGYSASFTAPNVSQEAAVIQKAMQAGGIDPESISYIEAHGTGTSLGDPIEVNGLKLAFKSVQDKGPFCAIGTAKANIGHAEGAAGIAGLLKVILSMKHKTLPAMPHLEELNPYVSLEESPFFINKENIPWTVKNGFPRRAGISSFGIGGAYAHVIVEEYEGVKVDDSNMPELESVFVISAKSKERLKVYAANMASYIEGHYLAPVETIAAVSDRINELILSVSGGRIEVSFDNIHFTDMGFTVGDFVALGDAIGSEYGCAVSPRQIALQQNTAGLAGLVLRLTKVDSSSIHSTVNVQDIAYTMQVGREPMEYRFAMVVADKYQLVEALNEFAENDELSAHGYFEHVGDHSTLQDFLVCPEGDAFIVNLVQSGRLEQLAKLWVSGVKIPWQALASHEKAKRVHLPAYPFAKQRYWFTDDTDAFVAPESQQSIVKNRVIQSTPQSADTIKVLSDIWLNYLSVASVNRDDNFLALGGTSITSSQVVFEINRTLATHITVGQFTQCDSLDDVCKLVDEQISNQRTKGDESTVSYIIPILSKKENIALSSDQLRLWVLSQMYPKNTRHNISSAYLLSGVNDEVLLQQSLDFIVSQHAALRTVFSSNGSEPVQNIVEHQKVDLQVINNSQSRESTLDSICDAASIPFDLESGPLLKVMLIREANQQVLSVVAHHIIADISSVDIIARDLVRVFSLKSQGASIGKMTSNCGQFNDYLLWSAQAKLTSQEDDLAFWGHYLKDAPVTLNLPFDFPRTDKQTHNSSQVSLDLDVDTCLKLDVSAKSMKVTRFILAYAVFNILLSRLCQQNDVLVGVPNANRSIPDTQNMVGFLANTLVLRNKIDFSESFSSFVASVKKSLYLAFDHQGTGFGDVMQGLNIPSVRNHNPLFQVLFNMIERDEYLVHSDDCQLKSLDIPLVTLDFDILFSIDVRGSKFRVSMDYNPDLFSPLTAGFILESYRSLLADAVGDEVQGGELLLSQMDVKLPLERNTVREKPKLIITSTFTADPIKESLGFWVDKLGLGYGIEFAPYNQVFQQLLDPSLALQTNDLGINIVLIRYEDWVRYHSSDSKEANKANSKQLTLSDFLGALRTYSTACSTPLVVCVLPSFGEDTNLHKIFDQELKNAVDDLSHVDLLSCSAIQDWYPVETVFDSVADEIGHIPFTPSYFTGLGTSLVRFIRSKVTAPYKVIVVDCDNTLWKGVVGEVGVDGIEVDAPRKKFQKFLVEQVDRGMLLCLASKNVESDIDAVFDNGLDMPLKREHILAAKVNWQPKHTNIQLLSEELSLGLDSFIFIDDNPIECAEMEAILPEVLTVQFPQGAHDIEQLQGAIWDLDVNYTTLEDKSRTQMYRQNIKRQDAEKASGSFADFLEKLELKIEIEPVDSTSMERVEQLMQRTNQFNATTQRYTAGEIQARIDNDTFECLTVHVSDRFGDYGLVGVLLFQVADSHFCLDSFLLSCRVLGKGVEQKMLRTLASRADKLGIAELSLNYVESGKNVPIKDFYESLAGVKWDGSSGCYLISTQSAGEAYFSPQTRNSKENVVKSASKRFMSEKSPRVMAQVVHNLRDVESIQHAMTVAIGQPPRDGKQANGSGKGVHSEIENQLVNIYQSILHTNSVNTEVSFFELGGTSLQLVALASEINSKMGKNIPITVLFQFPSIASLSQYLSGEENSGGKKAMSKSRQRALRQREIIKRLQVA